jgi:uncharacterized NAD(P)/FAD-binding protein YdhS
MSALPDLPGHFADWAAAAPASFLPRRVYGEYLEAVLAEAAARSAAPLHRVTGEAVAVTGGDVLLADGRVVSGAAVVLALGVGRPAPLRLDGREPEGDRYVGDPWRPGALDGVGTDGPVLCVGSGLTAVDVVLTLADRGIAGPVTLLSRRGLLPAAHAVPRSPASTHTTPPIASTARGLLRAVRRDLDETAAAGGDWRSVVDGLRPHTVRLWQGLSAEERCRLLRHAGRHWDAARHRMAPEVAATIDGLRRTGALHITRGRVVAVCDEGTGLRVFTRHAGRVVHHRAGHVVNCTGPSADVTAAGHGLIDRLLATGQARTDPLRLGLDVDDDGRVRDRAGLASRQLYAVGPLRRGHLWESTAVPEIRGQAAALAELLDHAKPDLPGQDYPLRVPA